MDTAKIPVVANVLKIFVSNVGHRTSHKPQTLNQKVNARASARAADRGESSESSDSEESSDFSSSYPSETDPSLPNSTATTPRQVRLVSIFCELFYCSWRANLRWFILAFSSGPKVAQTARCDELFSHDSIQIVPGKKDPLTNRERRRRHFGPFLDATSSEVAQIWPKVWIRMSKSAPNWSKYEFVCLNSCVFFSSKMQKTLPIRMFYFRKPPNSYLKFLCAPSPPTHTPHPYRKSFF